MGMAEHTVFAGVDGSESASRAALWAAADAARQHASLHLVLAYDTRREQDRAEQTVRDIAERCRTAHPGLHIADEAVRADPVDDLLSRRAWSIVVGSRGHGAFRNAVLGSVSTAVAAHADCPVVVIRGKTTDPEATGSHAGPVVVGIGPSRTSPPAVRFAFAAAERHEAELIAVQAVPDAYLLPNVAGDQHRQDVQEAAEEQVSGLLSECQDQHPGVVVRRVTSGQHPVEALCEQAEAARLAVVGKQRRSAARLGPTALGTLHHAPCPVAVVPHDEDL